MVKKVINVLIVLIVIIGTMETKAQSLLWEVSGNGLEAPSYLFGTIHLICSEDFLMDDRILNALQSSNRLVMEMDMSNPNLQLEIQQYSLNPGMENVAKHMTDEELEKMNALLKSSFGMELSQIGVLKPFMLSSMLILTQINCADELSSYEMYFVEQAAALEMEIKGLETPQFQATLFDNIPLEEQVRELVKVVTEPEKGQQQFKDMVALYKNEDLDALLGLISEDEYFGRHGELFLDKRNQAWIEPIEALMKEGAAFIAVGAGHMSGEQGVIQLLKNQGYSVQPVSRN